jgi:hypothetical protein
MRFAPRPSGLGNPASRHTSSFLSCKLLPQVTLIQDVFGDRGCVPYTSAIPAALSERPDSTSVFAPVTLFQRARQAIRDHLRARGALAELYKAVRMLLGDAAGG